MQINIFKTLGDYKSRELPAGFKTERSKRITSLILTLVGFSFLGLFAISPTLSTIAKLKKELVDNKTVDQGLQQKISNLSTLQKKYSSLQNDLPTILSALPKTSQIPYLLALIQAVAQNSNIELDTLQGFQAELFKETGSDKNPDYYAYSFSLAGIGTFGNISKLISSLTNMQRIANIEVLSISKVPDGMLRINIQGLAYYKQ